MWNDLRFTLRTLRRSPGFALVAIASLALGIGANAAIFSLLYQVTLRTIPVKDPESLALLQSDDYAFGATRRDDNASVFSYPMYRAIRDNNHVFTGVIGRALFPVNLAWHGDALRGSAEVVTGNFFQVLGIRPALGRLLIPDDDNISGQNPVIVLSYSCWTTRMGRDPNILNSRVLMNNQPVLVVGVAPQGFRSLVPGRTPDFFAPVSLMAMIEPGWESNDKPDSYWLNVFGRLSPGVSPQRANAQLLPLFRSTLAAEIPQFEGGVPTNSRKRLVAKTLSVVPAAHGINEFGDEWQAPLVFLMVMVGLVLLIACTNVANLLVARATGRQREFALRRALGASGWQVVRQLLVESLALTIAGALIAFFLSQALTAGLLHLLPADESGGWLAAQSDFRVLAFSVAVSLVTGLLFGMVPAVQTRSDVASALKEQGTAISAGGSQPRIRQALVVAQVGLSLMLLVGAGLFVRRLLSLNSVDPGFRPEHLITFAVDPSLSGYSRERTVALFHDAQERLRALPAIRSAAGAALAPFAGWNWGSGVKVPGSRRANDQYADCGENAVGPGYFRTLGIPLLSGREFEPADSRISPKVAIINETFARFLFDNESPIGRHMIAGPTSDDLQIVGVVKDAKYSDVREKPQRFLYVPFDQDAGQFVQQVAFFLRGTGSDSAVFPAIRAVMHRLDPSVPVDHLASMQGMIADSIYRDRLLATLAVAFGVLASILVAVGLYGTVSYTVARRTREFGIRLALGAVPQRLLLTVLREVGWLAGTGIAIGLPLSYFLARYAQSKFDGISALDPGVLVGAMLLVTAVAFLAALAPALQAMRIDPVRALKYE